METRLADFIRDTPAGREAEAILRRCVHCGFCTATCPTYQLTGDELDGPRGRIYLIKQMLEGAPATEKTRLHLDRCLTCRACETTCPSGVAYGRLLDIGREAVVTQSPRRGWEAVKRSVLRSVLPNAPVFGAMLRLARTFRPLLPVGLRAKLPPAPRPQPQSWPQRVRARRMIALAGCVQPALLPDVNAATARLLDALGITLTAVPAAGCCGALRFHLDDAEGARADARRNIDAWWPLLESGAEAIVVTASGCGVQVKDYGHLLRDDVAYATKAARVAALARDVSEVLLTEADRLLPLLQALPPLSEAARRLAFHSPCTLQHGQRLSGVVESLLGAAGYELMPVADAHLCCGSAGTYSLLQPAWAQHLLDDKLAKLSVAAPMCIASANVGCIAHLQSGTALPVKHWVEFIAMRVSAAR